MCLPLGTHISTPRRGHARRWCTQRGNRTDLSRGALCLASAEKVAAVKTPRRCGTFAGSVRYGRAAQVLTANACDRDRTLPTQAYTALLNSAVKCGEAELAADVYGQLRQEGFALERPVFQTVLEVFLKLGRWDDALGVIADMHAQVRTCRWAPRRLLCASCPTLSGVSTV